MTDAIPELAGLSEAEEFFEVLGVAYDPAVLASHRLRVVKLFGLALRSWLDVNPRASRPERRAAAARALREAHDAFADEAQDDLRWRSNPFAPGLVRLRRR
jgi:nitrogenase-stabilizing/protective protein